MNTLSRKLALCSGLALTLCATAANADAMVLQTYSWMPPSEETLVFVGDLTVSEARFYGNGFSVSVTSPSGLYISGINFAGPALDASNSVERNAERLVVGTKLKAVYINCGRGTLGGWGLSYGVAKTSNFGLSLTANVDSTTPATSAYSCRLFEIDYR